MINRGTESSEGREFKTFSFALVNCGMFSVFSKGLFILPYYSFSLIHNLGNTVRDMVEIVLLS